jgi:inosine/xanthosine triphosphatase
MAAAGVSGSGNDGRAVSGDGDSAVLRVSVGTTNPTKLAAVQLVLSRLLPGTNRFSVEGVTVPSDVSAQPMSAEETRRGAVNRAQNALKSVAGATLGIGLEGGLERVGTDWFECGWIAVAHRDGRVGLGSSARFQVAEHIVARLQRGEELASVIDDLSGSSDVRSTVGMMGVITLNHLHRAEAYSHGVMFALAPFISEPQYWDGQHHAPTPDSRLGCSHAPPPQLSLPSGAKSPTIAGAASVDNKANGTAHAKTANTENR